MEIVEYGWLNFTGLGVNHGSGISLGDVDRDGKAEVIDALERRDGEMRVSHSCFGVGTRALEYIRNDRDPASDGHEARPCNRRRKRGRLE